MHWVVTLLYSIYWLLHVLAVSCHHQGASYPSELLEIQIEWVVYHIMCGYVGPRNHTLTLYDIPSILFVFHVTQKDKKLPEDGRLLPKHVGASI
jgi:hypothetical protein